MDIEHKNVENSNDSVQSVDVPEMGKSFKEELPDEDKDKPVTRGEIDNLLRQLLGEMQEISNSLTNGMNLMFKNNVFSFQLRLGAIEKLLIDKGILTSKEIADEEDKAYTDLQNKAIKKFEDDRKAAEEAENKEKRESN